MTELRVICAAAGERKSGEGGDYPNHVCCDPISSQPTAKGRYSGFIIVYHERSKHRTPKFTNFETLLYLSRSVEKG